MLYTVIFLEVMEGDTGQKCNCSQLIEEVTIIIDNNRFLFGIVFVSKIIKTD